MRYRVRWRLLWVVFVVLSLFTGCGSTRRDVRDAPQHRPKVSGTADESELPWRSNPKFHEAQNAAKTPILMVAFRAVLKDPIEGEAANIALAADRLSGTVVPPGAVFSQNGTLGPYSAAKGYHRGPNYSGGQLVIGTGGGVCKIATMLYNLSVLSDLPVIERRPHSMVVPYVPPGQDATVSDRAGVDFKFQNSTSQPLMIWGEKVGDTLYMAFYGQEEPPQVTWHHETLSHTKATVVRRPNQNLQPGEKREVSPGFDGYRVHSWIDIVGSDGRKTTKDFGVSAYRMSPQVVEFGPDDS